MWKIGHLCVVYHHIVVLIILNCYQCAFIVQPSYTQNMRRCSSNILLILLWYELQEAQDYYHQHRFQCVSYSRLGIHTNYVFFFTRRHPSHYSGNVGGGVFFFLDDIQRIQMGRSWQLWIMKKKSAYVLIKEMKKRLAYYIPPEKKILTLKIVRWRKEKTERKPVKVNKLKYCFFC